MAAQDSLFKLQSYQRTQNLIHDLNFTKATALPKAVESENLPQPSPVESSQSFLLHRTLDSVNKHDMTLVREHLKVFSELDPANPYYSSLLERINHGEHLTWKEFEDAVSRFSSQEYYMTKLQDEINNEKINAALQGIPEQEIEKSPTSDTETTPPQRIEEAPKPDSPGPAAPEAPHPSEPLESMPRYTRPQGLSRRGAENLKKADQVIQKTQNQIKQGNGPQLSEKMSTKLNSANRIMRVQPPVSQLNRRSIRKASPVKKLAPKFGTAAALGGSGAGGSSLISNLLGARGALQAGQWLANKLGLRSLGNLLGKLMPEKLIAQGIRGLWNLGSSFGRAAFDGLIRSVLPRAGFSALGGAGSTIGGWLSGAGAVIGTIGLWPILAWAIFILSAFFFIFAVYDANTECGQPGKVELNKTAVDSAGSLKESFEPEEQINYKITLNYSIKCSSAYLDRVEVKDILPPSLSYVPNSAKSSKVAELAQSVQEIDDPFFGEDGVNTLPGQIDPEFPAADDIKLDGNILTWRLGKVPSNTVITMSFSATPNQTDTWISNQVTAGYVIVSNSGLSNNSNGVINIQSATLQETINQAAQSVGMEPALMKAFLRVEAPGALSYTEEEFRFFSTPGWWEGLEANASTLQGNDPTIIRGYAYNTCAYRSCAPGADVRGVTQFEAKTWGGIESQLKFADGHTPDRRNAIDAIFGSALLNRQNAQYYTGSPNFEWTEEVIRAAGRIYCGGPGAARRKLTDGACMADGKQYEDLLWDFYQQYKAEGL